LGVLYDYQERFSYLLDNYFEIKRHKEEKSGTTRTLHIENISDDFNIIDTPALTHSQYQISHKGIFMGDIGVYMIEASKVKKMSEKILQYKEIFLWSKLKENDTLLVLISISDLLEEIELKSVYEEIVDLFNGELKMNLKIIPISINRNEGTDCNVYTKAYNWYKGKTLIETLDSMIEQNESNLKDFCVFIDRSFDHSDKQGKGIGRTWRGKVIVGSIGINDVVKIAPVKYETGYHMAKGKIKSIMDLDNNSIDTAGEEEIIGINLSETKIENNKVEKSQFETCYSTFIVSKDISIAYGTILRFTYNEPYAQFELRDSVIINWCGKFINGRVVSVYNNTIIVRLDDRVCSIPKIDNKYLYTNYILNKENCDKYIKVNLEKLGEFNKIRIICTECESPVDWNNVKTLLTQHLVGEYIVDCDEDSIVIYSENCTSTTLNQLIKDIECALDKKSEEDYAIFDIKLSISEQLL